MSKKTLIRIPYKSEDLYKTLQRVISEFSDEYEFSDRINKRRKRMITIKYKAPNKEG